MTRHEAERALAVTLATLGDDELRVLAFLAQRLAAGQRQYGRLAIVSDARDWRKERAEEFADAAVYHALVSLAQEPPS